MTPLFLVTNSVQLVPTVAQFNPSDYPRRQRTEDRIEESCSAASSEPEVFQGFGPSASSPEGSGCRRIARIPEFGHG